MLKSNEVLDHGVSVPLHFLNGEKMDFAIVPVNYCFLSYQKHYDFGVELKEAIFNSDKRIAVIASGDLSHRLSFGAPAGFSARAKDFDKKLVQLLKQRKAEGVLNIDRELIEEAGECGLRSILVLLGVFEDLNYSFQVLSYEAPFGVGYLVGECQLP
jgi:AmmeMemoRadiSam system protein B